MTKPIFNEWHATNRALKADLMVLKLQEIEEQRGVPFDPDELAKLPQCGRDAVAKLAGWPDVTEGTWATVVAILRQRQAVSQ